MEIKIFEKKYNVHPAWAVDGKSRIPSYIRMSLILSWHYGFTFAVDVPDKTFCRRNPFAALLAALQNETAGRLKYSALKERVRELNFWTRL